MQNSNRRKWVGKVAVGVAFLSILGCSQREEPSTPDVVVERRPSSRYIKNTSREVPKNSKTRKSSRNEIREKNQADSIVIGMPASRPGTVTTPTATTQQDANSSITATGKSPIAIEPVGVKSLGATTTSVAGSALSAQSEVIKPLENLRSSLRTTVKGAESQAADVQPDELRAQVTRAFAEMNQQSLNDSQKIVLEGQDEKLADQLSEAAAVKDPAARQRIVQQVDERLKEIEAVLLEKSSK
jgi:hypothetical protein